jgi:methylmalonyl-CoA mutase cobalamin-binding domain/chain
LVADKASALRDCITNFRVDDIQSAVHDAVKGGLDPNDVVKFLSEGMNIIGQRYERQEVFLAELIMASETMKEGMKALNTYLKADSYKNSAVVVIGTVKGDLHDIGKDIAKTFLMSKGFEVHDLGIDVAPERFVESVRSTGAGIVGISVLLTTTLPEIKNTIRALEEAGMRSKVKVIVGGAALTEKIAKDLQADAYAVDAVSGTERCVEWTR